MKKFALMLAVFLGLPASSYAGPIIDFALIVDNTHANVLTYPVQGGPFIGTDLMTFVVTGDHTPLNNGVMLTLNSRFDFITGTSLGSTATTWTFDSGGAFQISDVSNSYFSGEFADTSEIRDLGNGFKSYSATLSGVLGNTIASFYGVSASEIYTGGLTILFRSNATAGNTFTGRLASGNLAVNVPAVPEPSTIVLGLLSIPWLLRRR